MSESDDPMDGAAVGETRTVQEDVTVNLWDFYAADSFLGSDRVAGDIDLVDVAYGVDDGDESVTLTFEGDVTKTLPRRWDTLLEDHPKNQARGRNEPRNTLVSLGALVVTSLVAFGVAAFVATRAEVTVNGEAVFPATLVDVTAMVPFFMLIVFAVWAIPRFAMHWRGSHA